MHVHGFRLGGVVNSPDVKGVIVAKVGWGAQHINKISLIFFYIVVVRGCQVCSQLPCRGGG